MGPINGITLTMIEQVTYLGPLGTYSEEACQIFYPNADRVPLVNLKEVIHSVENGLVNEAVAPIENSLAGTITDIIDALINSKKTRIISEILLPIEICLIVAPDMDIQDIKVIRSKNEALNQCKNFIDLEFPNVECEPVESTASAVESLKFSNGQVAALGPRRSARINSMKILKTGIQDKQNNVTRFIALGTRDPKKTGNDKTSIVFDFDKEDSPGLVYAALKPFADADINLTKIESRPTGNSIGSYYFLLDFHGHVQDSNVNLALTKLQQHTSLFKILGSYPRATNPNF